MGAIENALASRRPKAGAISDGLASDIQWSNSQNSLSANWTPFVDNDDNLTYESVVAIAPILDNGNNVLSLIEDYSQVSTGNFEISGQQLAVSMWVYPESLDNVGFLQMVQTLLWDIMVRL